MNQPPSSEVSHKDFMRQLSAEDKRTLTVKTNSNGVIRLAILVTLLGFCSATILSQPLCWQLLLLPQGLLLVSLFHLLHECIHDTPFRNRRLNSVVGAICGFILLLPSEWFRYFHRDHHRYTQIEGKDPELETKKPETRIQWLLHISGFPVFISLLKVNARCATNKVSESFIPASAQQSVIKQARIMAGLYSTLVLCSVIFQNYTLLTIWTVPLITGQPFLRLYLLAEHTLCENTDDMLMNTRTVLTNPIVRWFTWNMPYHTEHHVYPAVPFHQLPALHIKMTAWLNNTDRSYVEFNRRLYNTLR